MGKIAQPGVSYCDGKPQASLSIGASIIASTTNPPISYTLDGTTATISDAGGVIGVADVSGALTENLSQPASPDTDYCAEKPKAVLTWDGGESETTNTPISYTIESIGIKVDWGNDDIDYLPGISWEITTDSITDNIPLYKYVVFGDIYSKSGYLLSTSGTCYSYDPLDLKTETGPINPVTGQGATLLYSPVRGGINLGNPYTLNGVTAYVSGAGCSSLEMNARIIDVGGGGAPYTIVVTNVVQTIQQICPVTVTRITVTTNTGATSFRLTDITPDVTRIPLTVTLSIFDATGEIASYSYRTKPSFFRVTCYDYDLLKISYACKGECPSGTEWQCICTAEDKRFCYGFDPDNPDVFRPLYDTTLTP